MTDEAWAEVEQTMRLWFESSLQHRIERRLRIRTHKIIPDHYFATVSSQCGDMFSDGYFYGCICLTQALAEAIARFLATKNSIPIQSTYQAVINSLQKDRTNPVITPQLFAAFRRIHGYPIADRNVYHHLGEGLELNRHELEARAEECLIALYEIESDIFEFHVDSGKLVPKYAQYWAFVGPDLPIYLRQ